MIENEEQAIPVIKSPTSQTESSVGKALGGLKAYLTDWKNLLGHALLGVGFLVLAIWAPINIWIKLAIIAALVTFNVFRMRRKKK